MSSQKESKTFFWFAVLFLAMVFAVSIALLGILVLGIKDLSKWLMDYGGLLGSVFAVVIASYTIKKQAEGIERQIVSNRELEDMRALRGNVSKALDVVSRLNFIPFEILRLSKDQEDCDERMGALMTFTSENTRSLQSLCSKIGGERIKILSISYQAVFLGIAAIKMDSLGLVEPDSSCSFLDAILSNRCTKETIELVELCKQKASTDAILRALHSHLIELHSEICHILSGRESGLYV